MPILHRRSSRSTSRMLQNAHPLVDVRLAHHEWWAEGYPVRVKTDEESIPHGLLADAHAEAHSRREWCLGDRIFDELNADHETLAPDVSRNPERAQAFQPLDKLCADPPRVIGEATIENLSNALARSAAHATGFRA